MTSGKDPVHQVALCDDGRAHLALASTMWVHSDVFPVYVGERPAGQTAAPS